MSFLQNALKTIAIGDINRPDCKTQMYTNCQCSNDAIFIGAIEQKDYYTYWSFIGFCISIIIITLISTNDNFNFFKMTNNVKNILLPIAIAFIVNSLAVGFTSNLLFSNLKIDTPGENQEPNAMDFYAFRILNDTNFIFHVLPVFVSMILFFGLVYIKKTDISFWNFYLRMAGFHLLFYFVWLLVPAKVIKDYRNVEETVWGPEKMKYTYSDPSWYIFMTFPIISIIVGMLITLTIIKKNKK